MEQSNPDYYRRLKYINTRGETLDLNIPINTFLYDLTGAGFEYTVNVVQNNYLDHIDIASVMPISLPIGGTLTFRDAANKNASIYEKKDKAEKILNYDQLINRRGKLLRFGRLEYHNARNIQVFSPAVVETFSFGEITTDTLKELDVLINFRRGSHVWTRSNPHITVIALEGNDEAHFHPYSHPWTHGLTYNAGNGSITAIGGTDNAKVIIRLYGEIDEFMLDINSVNGNDPHRIIYKGAIPDGSILEINNFDIFAQLDGVNAIPEFDLVNGDTPFFPLLPNTEYSVRVESPNMRGRIVVEMYETFIGVP